MARNAFNAFIPMSAETTAHKNIIFDFFDLLAAVAAHGKMNGLGGRKLSRLAGWWAFAHVDDGLGFEGGYRSWEAAADATSHLFFAYLRSLSPDVDPSMNVIERIPRSLQALLISTEYPPETPTLLQRSTPRVVMVVDNVSPTPFALLRRAKHFEYRADDTILREYQEFEDPLDALTEENKRVLYAISSTNSSSAMSRHGNMMQPQTESWSAFQNLGFSDLDEKSLKSPTAADASQSPRSGLRSEPRSRNADYGRPTTPSWADFMSSGFQDDDAKPTPTFIMPPDQVLPPIGNRQSSMHLANIPDDDVAPGELAAIRNVELDDAFWWVWMTSLAGEEPAARKAVFGRCVLVETTIMNGNWLVMEEQVKGASPDPAEGAYIAPKKSFFSFTKRGRLGRKRSVSKKPPPSNSSYPMGRSVSATPSKTSLAPDQHNRIKAAAAALARKANGRDDDTASRRGRMDESAAQKTSSMLTVGMMSEATPAMKWASAYDKNAIRAQYLGDGFAGTGVSREDLVSSASNSNLKAASAVSAAEPTIAPSQFSDTITERSVPTPVHRGSGIDSSEPPAQIAARLAVVSAEPPSTVVPTNAGDLQDMDDEAAPIASIPRSPMEKELGLSQSAAPVNIGRKPLPPVEHPAFRAHSIDDQAAPAPSIARKPTTPAMQNVAALAAARAMEAKNTSPESQKSSRPKKQGGGGGLRSLFGRKKDNRNSLDLQPQSNNGLAPPMGSGIGRRASLARKQPSNLTESTPIAATPAETEATALPAMMEPTMIHPPSQHGESEASRMSSWEVVNAEQEFARFDQGPVHMPGTPPQYHPEEQDVAPPVSQHHFNTDIASRIAPEPLPETTHDSFVAPGSPVDVRDDAQSEATMDEPRDDVRIDGDRWAKIRDNAAKRTAARQSEEQSRPATSIKTEDDGETSGEESKPPI